MIALEATTVTLLTAVITMLATAGVTLWSKRRNGPDAVKSLVSTSAELLAEMRIWNTTLLERVEVLEAQLAIYRAVYGPLEDDEE